MRNAVIYLLLIATLMPSLSQWGVIAYYHANKDYIARVLCENRDRPQLHCDGTCYLAKRLKASQERQDKETTERVQNLPAMALFCNEVADFAFASAWRLVLTTGFPSYRAAATTAPLSELFRPPRV